MSSIKTQFRRALASLTSAPDFGEDAPTVAAAMAMTERYRLTDLLPYRGWDTDNSFLMMDDGTELGVGFGFELKPAILAGTSMEEQLEAIIVKLPDNSVLQVGILVNDDVHHQINRWEQARTSDRNKYPLLKEMARRRAAFYRECAKDRSLLPNARLHTRAARCFAFIRVPYAGDQADPRQLDDWIRRMRELQNSVYDAFTSSGLPARKLDGPEHRRLLVQLLNPQFHVDELDKAYGDYRGFPKGLLRKEGRIRKRPRDGAIMFTGGARDTAAVTITVDSYPQDSYLPETRGLLGDIFSRSDVIPDRFWIWTVIHCPNRDSARDSQNMKLANITRMTLSDSDWFRSMASPLFRRRDDTQHLLEVTASRRTLVRSTTGITVFCDPDQTSRAVENVTAIWRRAGFEASPESSIAVPMYLAAMPYGYNWRLDHDGKGLQRLELMTSFNAACLLPVACDWGGHDMGCGGPTFVSRRGLVGSLDFLVSETNYNATIVAQSGSGKSYFTAELVSDYLSRGGFVRMIDVGRSYARLAEIIGGENLTFEVTRPRSMNPFWGMRSSNDLAERAASLREIATLMAYPLGPPPNWEFALIEKGISTVFQHHGEKLETKHLWEWLSKQGDQRLRDMADQFEPYAVGRLKLWFNGPPQMDMSNDFTILELEELNADKLLRSVVLTLVINGILDDMYRREQREGQNAMLRPKLLGVDEAWDLMGKESGRSGRFIEEAARRIRKYRGTLATVTQSYEDYFQSESARAALTNAAWRVSLSQSGQSIDCARKNNVFGEDNDVLWKMLPTVKRGSGYSELHIMNSGIGDVMRLIIDPYSNYTFSTAPADKNAIAERLGRGMSLIDAIGDLADEADRRARGYRQAA